MPQKLTIGVLGAGKMATALAQGLLRAKLVAEGDLLASDVAEEARLSFAAATGARTTGRNSEVARFAQVLILAVKPDQITGVLDDIRNDFTEKHVLVSVAAGVPLSRLQAELSESARIVRVMPNTPALVGCSATAYALGTSALPEDGDLVQRLFSSVGVAFRLKEPLLDAVTGLSGSGPAYVYLVIEALSDGGVAEGLPRATATRLAAQTVMGAAKMVLESGLHPAALKDMVASPGGTTIEGLHALERGGLRGTLMSAVRAATDKARRMGQQ